MGTGPFAVPTFQRLLNSSHEIVCLVTRPDKVARGRKKAAPNPMRETAEAAGVAVFAPENINADDGLQLLDQQSADLYVVCDYGQILSKTALGKPRLGGINLHGSLLPRYRGAAPINWAILNGDRVAGITVIHMTPRLDGGPMISRKSLEVGDDEDAVHLEERLSQLGIEAVMESIELLESWDGESTLGELQRKAEVTKAPRLNKSDGEIDWTESAEQIFNRVRALKPWPGTFTNLLRDGKPPMRVIVQKVSRLPAELAIESLSPGQAVGFDPSTQTDSARNETGKQTAKQAGKVKQIVVRCGDGAIAIDRIQPAGKREMEAEEFMRGYGEQLSFGTTS